MGSAQGRLSQHMVRDAGEFMLARYREVVSTVLFYTRSNEKLIRRAVIQMLPRLAAFAPERFARMHLEPCPAYLLSVLKNPSERGAGVQPSNHSPVQEPVGQASRHTNRLQ